MTPDDIHQLINAVVNLLYACAGVLAHRFGVKMGVSAAEPPKPAFFASLPTPQNAQSWPADKPPA